MKKIALLFAGLFLVTFSAGHVLAKSKTSYKYAIRIHNFTNSSITVKHAKYQIKGSSKGACNPLNNKKIKSKHSKRCTITNIGGQTRKHKWIVAYKCNGKKYHHSTGWWKTDTTYRDALTNFSISACGKFSYSN